MRRYQGQLIISALLIGFSVFILVQCEEECLGDKSYECFECDSNSDWRCKDPFNWTIHKKDMPGIEPCFGCCVKIVRKAHRPDEIVIRTCTKKIQINLFMVDHVCMYEGRRTGHMCFCEADLCNRASHHLTASVASSAFFAILSAFYTCYI